MSLSSSELPPHLGIAPEPAFDVLDARAAELCAYKAGHAHESWEAAINSLLADRERP